MIGKTIWCVLLLAAGLSAGNGQWLLATSTLTYRVSTSVGASEGVSHAAKGRGTCGNGQCSFRIEALVQSFESGDLDRDAQMILATRGAQFPVVTVRVSLPDGALAATSFHCDLEVEFAGQKAKYSNVLFQVSTTGVGTRITGTIPATLRDFKIDSTFAVKNELPVLVDMTWRPGY